MNNNHLWWIIPLCLVIGGFGGYKMGIYAFESFGEWACEISTAGMEMCVEMVGYMAYYDGYCNESLEQYSIDHNSTIQGFLSLYG